MAFSVVCISRTIAAGGEGIGKAIAQGLGFHYVDEQIIERAAEQAKIDPALVAAVEHRQPLLQRLIDRIVIGAELSGTVALIDAPPEFYVPSPSAYRKDPDYLRDLIRDAIHEVARVGKAVIVAHAASMALRESPGVLRVLITAPPTVRAQRLVAVQGITAADATAAVAASDRERRDYLVRFYKIKEELPTLYDVVINTEVVAPAHAVEAILAIARSAG